MSYAIKVKIRNNKTNHLWFAKQSQAAASLYNECLGLELEKADKGESLLSNADLDRIFRSDKSLRSDYKDKITKRAYKSCNSWYQSEELRYEVYLNSLAKQKPHDARDSELGKMLKHQEFQKDYRKRCKALHRKQLLVGRPRKKKKISLKFAIRKERQSTVKLKDKTIAVSVPGLKTPLVGRHNRILQEGAKVQFCEGIMKRDSTGDLWLSLVVKGERRQLYSDKPNMTAGIDLGLKSARTAVFVNESTQEMESVYQPERQRFLDAGLHALEEASNHDTRALSYIHRKIARRRRDNIDKEIHHILRWS